ncbi:HNH endonuclease [Nocardia farcinica]|uniref:HNH endonuclease n=1 Tax=Nocardia farcinica TaxID=37329 RepID=UPI001E42D912|nr:HNH endonuclease [Nocardia farcinica]UEX21166.1 HNH endonuclease [Nocardia farcinica]
MVIRQLKSGERVPDGEPARYPHQRGYIRLRWRIGTNQYVEVYEHRVVDGVVTDAEEVHHVNGVKDDNRPENLQPMTKHEHAKHHGEHATRSYGPYRSREAMEKAERAAARRAARAAVSREMRELYEAGMSTVEIGKRYGIDASGVSRRLRQVGTRMRPRNNSSRSDPSQATRQAVHARSHMRCERCGSSLVWDHGEIHHRRHRSQGVDNSLSNLLHLCSSCHGWVEANPGAAHMLGFWLRHGEQSAATPVWLWGRWVQLDDNGDIHEVEAA